MVSRRLTIYDALVTRLNTITLANNFNTDLGNLGGAQKISAVENQLAVLPTVLVSFPDEQKEVATNTYFLNRVVFELTGYIDGVVGTASEDQIEILLEDVELLLLTEKALVPPFGVVGVDEIDLDSHFKWAVTDENMLGFGVAGTIQYRHDLTDPGAYTG